MHDLKASVIQFCAEMGNDPLLVQGAGGNVSWKDSEVLWIKASGTWLADVAMKDLFVPVDLKALQSAINIGNFSVTPTLVANSVLKPSIETLLHALMPQPIVVHLHAIEILAYLVRHDCETVLDLLLGDKVPWAIVDYYKPGAELAVAIKCALDDHPNAAVIFMKNHGVVIGGSNVDEIRHTLNLVTVLLTSELAPLSHPNTTHSPVIESLPISDYAPISDNQLHHLATDAHLFNCLQTNWALYPDHVVFLGTSAHVYQSFDELKQEQLRSDKLFDLVFVNGKGVFVTPAFNRTKVAQLRCYYDVLTRQPQSAILSSLSQENISDLLTRDDEQHRILVSKK